MAIGVELIGSHLDNSALICDALGSRRREVAFAGSSATSDDCHSNHTAYKAHVDHDCEEGKDANATETASQEDGKRRVEDCSARNTLDSTRVSSRSDMTCG